MPSCADPTVAVIAVVYGEPCDRLSRMGRAIAEQDYRGPIELVLAAPRADHERVALGLGRWSRGEVRLVDNPTGSRTVGLNECIEATTADYVVRVDARSIVGTDHVRRCVDRLRTDPTVMVAGAHQVTAVAPTARPKAAGIARALRNRWLLGHADYRDPAASGATDTVYLGAFRSRDLHQHPYDERLTANEDFDLCQRMRGAGGIVWLEPGLDVGYEPRDEWRKLFAQYQLFGRSKVSRWRRTGTGPNARQVMALGAAGLGVLLVTGSIRRPLLLAAGALVGATAVFVSDEISTGPDRVVVRAAALPAHAVIESGWLVGILREWLRPTVPVR